MSNLFNNPDNLVDVVRQILSGKPIEEKKEELDPVNKQAVKKKFDDRKDKDIDNDGDVDSTDKYLHKRRKAISKEINEKEPKKKINASHCEEVELDEAKEPFAVVDTADGNKVVGTASDEKGAKSIITSAELPPMKIKDKKTLKIVKVKKKQDIGYPLKEEVELDEAKGEDSDGEKMTAAQKKDMDGDGEKDKGEKKKKKKKDGEDDEPKADKINTEPETDEVKTMMSEREMTDAEKAKLDKMKKKYEGGEMHKAMKAKYGDKADEVFYGKLTKMAMGEAVEMNESNELVEFFKYEDIAGIRKEIEAGVKAPFVKTRVGTLGGKEKASIHITISLDDPSTWENKILHNSRYAMFVIHHPGNKLENHHKSYRVGKFRKSNIKNTKDIITKLNKWVKDNQSVKEEMNEDKKELGKISKELAGASKMHKGQSDRVKKIADTMKEAKDEEKDTNLIMQLRKAVSLRGNKVKFADGNSVVVSDRDAQKFMSMFSKLKKPAEKEMMMKSAAKSHKHFKMALSGRVEKPKSGGPDLPKLKSEK